MLERVGGWGRTERDTAAKWAWLLYGQRKEPAPGYTGLYEEPGDHVGVCCSGGGIRSAAFNLGALQVVLADRPLRERVKYLSAVSGGSYIAAAFCMVAKRWSGEPNGDDSDPDLVTDDALPFHPGSPEEQYLRNHLGYLAPDGSAKVYLALRMVAGLTVNVLLIGLPVLILGLALGLVANGPYRHLEDGTFHLPLGPVLVVAVPLGFSLALALLDVLWRPRKERLRAFARTWEVRLFVLACALFLLLIAVPVLAAWAASLGKVNSAGSGVIGSIGTALSSMGALALAAITHVRGEVKDRQKAIANAEEQAGEVRQAGPQRADRPRGDARRPDPAARGRGARRADRGQRRARRRDRARRRAGRARGDVVLHRPHDRVAASVLPPPAVHRVRAAAGVGGRER